MALPQHKTNVRKDSNIPFRSPLLKAAKPRFLLPPKASRVIPQNDQEIVVSPHAVDGKGNQAVDPNGGAQAVRVVELPTKREPVLKVATTIDLSAAPSVIKIAASGNTVLYADSTNGTDRLQIRYAKTDGDQSSQPYRSMVPGRLRREATFNFLYITWPGAVAGATATVEVYDDPDAVLEIFN